MIAVWQQLYATLSAGTPAVLMVVTRSKGSAPGKRGFKMAIAPDGAVCGTIGGGIMEHNLIDSVCRDLNAEKAQNRFLQQVHHRHAPPEQQSGMICAGSQEIAICALESHHAELVQTIMQAERGEHYGYLTIDDRGLGFQKGLEQAETGDGPVYHELIGRQDRVHIIGGGHVGQALAKTLEPLDFVVHLYDHRPDLATMQDVACQKTIAPYEQLGELIPPGPREYIVVVTTAWKSDAEALFAVIPQNNAYIGLMGSAAKIKTIFDHLLERGLSNQQLERVRAPVGVRIRNRTPAEIGISIAAELIDERNKRLES